MTDLNPAYRQSLRRHYGRIGLALFLYLAVTAVAQYLAQLIVAYCRPAWLSSDWFLVALSAFPMYLVGFPVFLAMLPPAPPKTLLPQGRRLPLRELCPLLLMCFGILYPGNLLGQGVNAILSGISGSEAGNPLETIATDSNLWAYGLLAVVLAPVMEEITFRKLLLDRMRTIDKPSAVFFSALAFGLFHGNAVQFFYAFGVGLLFGVIYLKTGKLCYTILLHILVNFFGSMVTMLLLPYVNLLDPMSALIPLLCLALYSLLLISAAIAGIVLLIKRRKQLRVGDGEDRLHGSERLALPFFTWGGLAYLVSALWMIFRLY